MKRKFGLLRERISNTYKTNGDFANALGIDQATLSKKLCGRAVFTHEEIASICELLEIQANEIGLYFFYTQSCKTATN